MGALVNWGIGALVHRCGGAVHRTNYTYFTCTRLTALAILAKLLPAACTARRGRCGTLTLTLTLTPTLTLTLTLTLALTLTLTPALTPALTLALTLASVPAA